MALPTDVSMSKSVQPAVEGLAAAFREGRARFAAVTPESTLDDPGAARRCQHCGEPVRKETDHTRAVVEIERASGDQDTCHPVFCDPTCLHVWSVEVDEPASADGVRTNPG